MGSLPKLIALNKKNLLSLKMIINKYKSQAYILGSLSSYLAQFFLVFHAIERLIQRDKPSLSITFFVAMAVFSMIVKAPYKWDRRLLRINQIIAITVYFLVLSIYILCLVGL